MSVCVDLIGFVDGELEPERAAAFRDHLSRCAWCQGQLVEALQLSTRLGSLTPTPDPASQAACPGKSLQRDRRASRALEASLPNRSGCAGVVVWTVGTLQPATAIAVLRMWPWVVSRAHDSTA